MEIICKICNELFKEDLLFHKHLKSHKTTQTIYYQTFYPRYDKYDGTIIKFKNKDYYFNTDFNSKNGFKCWLRSVTSENGQKYVYDFLTKRKDKKGMIYAPTQVELRTFMLPGIKYINKNLGGYDNLCEKIGLKKRFVSEQLNQSLFKDISKKVIFTDSREQLPLEFNNNTNRTKGMKFGDYRIADSSIYIERKSLGDFYGTLSGGFERFEKEIIRVLDAKSYLVILIESPFENIEKYPYQKQVYGKFIAQPEFVFHNIRILSQKYNHIQFLFVKDRNESSRVIEKIFSADNQIKDVDIQLLYDLGKL